MSRNPIVVAGPSGSGKSTLIDRLLIDVRDAFAFSVSHTTRRPRPGEQEGRDYFFVDRGAMENMIKRGEFVESAEFSGNLYGTSKAAVEAVAANKTCILSIDIQESTIYLLEKKPKYGVKQVLELYGQRAAYVFVTVGSLEVLEERLRLRKTESEESLQRRLDTAKSELKYLEENRDVFDLVLVNDDLDKAYQTFKDFMLKHVKNK